MVVAFYMTSALTMVFVNKAVLNKAPTLPVTFLLAQLSISVILLHVSALISPTVAKDIPRWDQIWPQTKQKWQGLWKVVSVNAIGLLFNTLCLRDVDASFFQIARGLVLPLTIITSLICIRARPTVQVVLAALSVTLGFLIGVAPSISPGAFRDIPLHALASSFTEKLTASPLSLFYGVLSSLFIALHAVWIKSSLPTVDNSAIALAWWSNAAGVLILFPLALLNGEVPVFINLLFGADTLEGSAKTFLIGSLVTGVVGFFLCIASLISIVSSSPSPFHSGNLT
jgi:GDP-fucose transporter C1